MVKDERTTTCTSTGRVDTMRVAVRTDSSAMDREDVVDEVAHANEPSHGGQMTDEHQFPKAPLCTISTSTPDSACSELPGTPLLVQSTISQLSVNIFPNLKSKI